MKVLPAIAFALLALAGRLPAQTFSLAGNWNFTSDSAANEWAYGTFNSSNAFVIPATITKSGTSEEFWTFPPAAGGSDPNIEKNTTSADIISSTSNTKLDFRPGTVSFGPYHGPAVAQFSAPAAGFFDITATFQTDQTRGNAGDGTAGSVYINGVETYFQTLSDPNGDQFGTPVTYSAKNIVLTSGEKVDFVVGGGLFTTEVDATLMEVPEPSIGLLLLGGSTLGALLLRRSAARTV
jgi:hypothetical protein